MKVHETDLTNQQLLEAISDMFQGITDIMVTKDDLKQALDNYPSKDDLKQALNDYPTKDDLKVALGDHPTKNDLKRELGHLERRVGHVHTTNVHHHLETRAMLGELNRKLA